MIPAMVVRVRRMMSVSENGCLEVDAGFSGAYAAAAMRFCWRKAYRLLIDQEPEAAGGLVNLPLLTPANRKLDNEDFARVYAHAIERVESRPGFGLSPPITPRTDVRQRDCNGPGSQWTR
jgi:hypothetical protein